MFSPRFDNLLRYLTLFRKVGRIQMLRAQSPSGYSYPLRHFLRVNSPRNPPQPVDFWPVLHLLQTVALFHIREAQLRRRKSPQIVVFSVFITIFARAWVHFTA
jgi:hypothetical protein